MGKFHNDMFCKLETAINELEIESECSLQRIETVICLIMECLSGFWQCGSITSYNEA